MIVSLFPESLTNNVIGEKTINVPGTYNASDDSLNGYDVVTVEVPPYTFGNITIEESGTYNANDYGYNAFSNVTVNVPSQEIIEDNQVYHMLDSGVRIKNVFNAPVTIPSTIRYCHDMFNGLLAFNQPVTIPENATDCERMFMDCRNFNQPINIPNSVNSFYGMFTNCRNFNQPINMPLNGLWMDSTFAQCVNFNQQVYFPPDMKENQLHCNYMFSECTNFNQPFNIPDNSYLFGAFWNCTSLNQILTIPNNTVDCRNIFSGCTALSDIYINEPYTYDGTTFNYQAYTSCLGNRNDATQFINVHIGTSDTSLFELFKNNVNWVLNGWSTVKLDFDSSNSNSAYKVRLVMG